MTVEDTPGAGAGRIRRPEQRRAATSALIEAAIAQLSDAGMRGLTHRKVEQEAGLAQGSTKYYFGTTDALAEAVLQHLADLDLPLVHAFTDAGRDADARGDDGDLLRQARAVAAAMLARPDHVRARFHLYLDASGDPRREAIVAEARNRFVSAIAESLPGPSSEAAARFVCAVIDGILLDQVSAPDPVVSEHTATYILAAGAAAQHIAQRTDS
ncbi:TetR/AcrR family transcriptional regulator [Propionibacteriaceae bacterium Y2011]